MKVITIEGQIETLGESIKEKTGVLKTYDYISMRTANNEDVIAKKVRVWNEVDRLLLPGMSGTFIFAKMLGSNELHAIRFGDQEAYSNFLQESLAKRYVSLGASLVGLLILLLILKLASGGLIFSLILILIGSPIVLLMIYAMIIMPFCKNQLISSSKQAGFQFNKIRSF